MCNLDTNSIEIEGHPGLILVAIVDEQGNVIPVIRDEEETRTMRTMRKSKRMTEFFLMLLTLLFQMYEEMD